MAVTATPYGRTFAGQYSATAARRIDWVTDTIKCALVRSAYIPDRDVDTYYGDVTQEVVTGGGYTAGGKVLTGKSVVYDAASHETRLMADPSVWAAASFTFRYAVLYKDTGVAGTSPLIGFVDFGADWVATLAVVDIVWDAVQGAVKVIG